jgi:SAM-dependent methyltransferase
MTSPGAGETDTDRPNIARVYDCLLGGSHNFAADRAFAKEFLARWPDARETMLVNRAFLARAVRFLAGEAGIRQFLDIGSGIPTMGNIHAIAEQIVEDAKVLYVDNDSVAVLHSRAILARDERATAIQADLRRPREILEHPDLAGLLDLSQPVALLLVAILHFFPDEPSPAGLVAQLRDALAPGSYVVITHGTDDGQLAQVTDAHELYTRNAAPFRLRSHAEILRFFDGLDLVEPGLVRIPLWRPDSPADDAQHAERIAGYAGAGRKR